MDCCDQIDLPPYKDYASLEQKLTLAVEETVGFGCVQSHCFLFFSQPSLADRGDYYLQPRVIRFYYYTFWLGLVQRQFIPSNHLARFGCPHTNVLFLSQGRLSLYPFPSYRSVCHALFWNHSSYNPVYQRPAY
jgi:hypothetical protein